MTDDHDAGFAAGPSGPPIPGPPAPGQPTTGPPTPGQPTTGSPTPGPPTTGSPTLGPPTLAATQVRPRLPLWPVLAALLLIVAIAAGLTIHLARSGALTIVGITNGDTERSLNWSGYVASHARFTSVTATWIVPAVRSTSEPGATASFWVGLDGRDGRSLQQIGTTSSFSGAERRYGAWWEMLPGPSIDVPLTIAPGDSVTASVVADGQGSFLLSLSDNTNGQRFTTRQVDAAAPLSSAEVVAEAPSSAQGLLPLADFGAVRFAGVRANGRPLAQFDSSRVIMTSGSRTVAAASALSRSGTEFTVAWERP